MAIFIPRIKPEDFNNSYGEREVYEALRSLNDKYTVFYVFIVIMQVLHHGYTNIFI